jgi:hypothetical protein
MGRIAYAVKGRPSLFDREDVLRLAKEDAGTLQQFPVK